MDNLHAFQVLLSLGCCITKFCFCSFGSTFQKPSKWLRNKPWYRALAGQCSCAYKNNHFTVQGTFTRGAIRVFESRCRPSSMAVYGKRPTPGEAVSSFSVAYPKPLCQVMAVGCAAAIRSGQFGSAKPELRSEPSSSEPEGDGESSLFDSLAGARRKWFESPDWIHDICESLHFRELFRYRFRKSGRINCLECRVFKSWVKHCAKSHPRCRLLGFLDSRVTIGATSKGRSSSKALSMILKSTLGYILGGCLYLGALHCRSEWNRADALQGGKRLQVLVGSPQERSNGIHPSGRVESFWRVVASDLFTHEKMFGSFCFLGREADGVDF